MITITSVEVSGDLQHAKIFISLFGEEKKKAEVLVGLEESKGFIRSELARRLQMRRSPELVFKIDKVMSKMGISTYQSYCGAQIFDAIGLSSDLIDKYFFGTASKVEGINLDEIEEETIGRHIKAFENVPGQENMLDVGGEYALRFK